MLLSLLYRKIVDSIMALFRVDFSGRGELSERQQKVDIPEVFSKSVVLTSLLAACSGVTSVVGAMYLQTMAQMLSKLSKISEEFNASQIL